MIDVPVRVKDALRDGRLRKNYRFAYYTEGTGYSVIDRIAHNATKTLDDAGKYRISIGVRDASFSISVTTISTSEVVDYDGVTSIYDTYVEFEISEASTLAITHIEDSSQIISIELYLVDSQITKMIDNNTLVKESVKIDERMATGKELKFGLCEGSSLEFQYFNHPNINGKEVDAYIDVQYIDENNDLSWYTIPMGRYTVDQCPVQWDTGIRKVTAYNKLRSGYLDQKMNFVLEGLYTTDAIISMFDIQKQLCDGYEIINDRYNIKKWTRNGAWGGYDFADFASSVYISQDYGIKTPVNPCNSPAIQVLSPFPMGVHCLNRTGYLPASYTLVSEDGSIIEIEQLVVDYIKKFVDEAGLNITGQEAIDYICANNGFQYVFGIRLNRNQGTYIDYSTVQWEYEEAHGIAHTVAGTLADLNGINTNVNDYLYLNFPDYIYWGNARQYQLSFNGENRDQDTYSYSYWTDSSKLTIETKSNEAFCFPNGRKYLGVYADNYLYVAEVDNLTDADNISAQISTLPDFTLRDILSATYELNCQYGKLDRETDLFSGVDLNHGGLYPADTLYPATTLYPQGDAQHLSASNYSKLWMDTAGEQSFRYLYITYKGLDANNQEVEKVLQRTVNADGTTDYNMSDNWLFKNLVWSDADVGDYADAMVLKMKDISWFPFEMWCAGLPYIETGDELEITNSEGTYTSYVLQRQLNGIQNLQDTFIDGELDIF